MKAIVSILCGQISFWIIAGVQIDMLMLTRIQQVDPITPHIYAIGSSIKLISIAFALTAIIFSILYSKTNKHKLKIINKLGMILGIIAILLCFIPIYLFI